MTKFIAVALLSAIAVIPSDRASQQPAPVRRCRPGATGPPTRATPGERDDGEVRVQMNLRTDAGDSRWGFGVRLSELTGLPPAALSSTATNLQFSWTREAGTFRFSGSFDEGRGSGTYTFTTNPAFVSGMQSAGYRTLSTDDIVRLALHDVTQGFVRGLVAGRATRRFRSTISFACAFTG